MSTFVRLRRVALAGSVLALTAIHALAQQRPAPAATLRLGQSVALSGPLAELGSEYRDGALAYFNWINSKGGIHGRKIELISSDDAYLPERTVDNVKQHLDENNVLALFGIMGSANYRAILPLLAERKIPSVAPLTGADDLRGEASPTTFWVRASYGDETEKIVEQLTTTGIKRVAVFYQDDDFGQAGLEGVSKALKARKLDVIAKGSFARNKLDVADAVKRIRAADPQAVVMISTYKATAAFVKAFRQSGSAAQLFAISTVGYKALSQELGKDAAGVAISQIVPYPWNGSLALNREFEAIPKDMQPKAGLSYTSFEGFIAAKVMVEALRRAGPLATREKLFTALESMNAYDAGGYTVSFGPGKHQGSRFTEMTIVGGSGRLMH